jgi:hypothetical protein
MRKHAVRRTSRSRSKLLPRLILSAFLVVGAAHCFCRFDMSSQMETFFAHAWAEVAPQVTAQPGQPANGSQPFASQPAGAPILVTIARNPFMAPSAITSKPLPVSPLPNHGAIPAKGGNGAGAPAPVMAAEPILRGIVQNGSAAAAIIEYAGKSGFYRVGQFVGEQRVNSISSNSVSLSGGDRLALGR